MADSELKINITTVADIAGATKTLEILDRLDAAAKRAGSTVDKSVAQVETTKSVAEFQKLEAELERVTAQMQQMQAAMDKMSSGSASPMTAPLVDLQDKGKAAATSMQQLAGAQREMGVSTEKSMEAIGYLARDLNDIFMRGGRGAIGNTMRFTTALGGTAGLGAAIGGVTMGLAMLWPHLKKLWEDVDPEKMKDSAKAMDEMAKYSAKLRQEVANEDFKNWVKHLDEGKEALDREAKAVEGINSLMKQRRNLQMEEEDKQAALALVKIDNDPKLNEEDKIRERMKVREEVEGRKTSHSLANVDQGIIDADMKAQGITAQKAEAQRRVEEQKLKVEQEAEKLRQMKIREQEAKAAEKKLPDLELQKKKADENVETAIREQSIDSKEYVRLAKVKADELAEGRIKAASRDDYAERKKAQDDIDTKEREELQRRKEALEAKTKEEAADEAARKIAYQMAEEKRASILRQAETEKQGREIIYNTAEDTAFRKRAEQDPASETKAEKTEAKAATEDERRRKAMEREAAEAHKIADDAAKHTLGGTGISDLHSRASAVQGDPNKKTIDSLMKMLSQLLDHFEKSGQKNDGKIQELEGRIKALQSNIKNNR